MWVAVEKAHVQQLYEKALYPPWDEAADLLRWGFGELRARRDIGMGRDTRGDIFPGE